MRTYHDTAIARHMEYLRSEVMRYEALITDNIARAKAERYAGRRAVAMTLDLIADMLREKQMVVSDTLSHLCTIGGSDVQIGSQVDGDKYDAACKGFESEMRYRQLDRDLQAIRYIGVPAYLHYVVQENLETLAGLGKPGYIMNGNAFDEAVEAMEAEAQKGVATAATATTQGNTHTPSIAQAASGEQGGGTNG